MANLMLSWQQAALLALGLGVAGALLRYAGHVAWAWRWGVDAGPSCARRAWWSGCMRCGS